MSKIGQYIQQQQEWEDGNGSGNELTGAMELEQMKCIAVDCWYNAFPQPESDF